MSTLVPLALQDARGRLDWAKLNYILIPSAQRATQTSPWPPTQGFGRYLFHAYSAFTGEGRFLLVVLLLIALFAGDVANTQVYVLFSALASLLGTSVLVSRFLRLDAAHIRVSAPERAFVGDVMDIHVSCTVPKKPRLRYERPFLPYFGQWVTAPASDAETSVHRVRFRRRGVITIGRFFVSRVGPLDLSSGPARPSEPVTVRIAPRPANVTKLTLPGLQQMAHMAPSAALGDTMLLRGLREYARGDRIKRISMRAWERTGRPMVREYYTEPSLHVGVLVLVSSRSEREVEALLQLAAGVVKCIAKQVRVDAFALGGTLFRNCSPARALDALAGYDPITESADDVLKALSAHSGLTWVVLTNQRGAREDAVVATLKPARVVCVDVAQPGPDLDAIERGDALAL